MLIHVQITTFWLQRKLEQRKQRQAANNMNKLKMFETKQVTPNLTKNLNAFFLSKGQNQFHLWTLDKSSRSPTLLHPPKMPQYTYRTHQSLLHIVPFCERPNEKPEGFAKQKQSAIFTMRHASQLVVHHPSLIYNVPLITATLLQHIRQTKLCDPLCLRPP
jgi:hypothetical protein